MEFVLLISEGGELWKTWVAAFYERRLRRQDYRDADVKRTVTFIIEHMRQEELSNTLSIPLHCHGHLLLGSCRILLRKAELLDDAAEELRLKLLTSSGRGAGRAEPVRRLVMSDVTLSHVVGEDAYMPNDDLFTLGDIGASLEIPGLNMLLEPEVPPMEADLDEGRRHAAPWSRITLPPDRPMPYPIDGPREAFGEASQVLQDVINAMRERAESLHIDFGPNQRLVDPDAALPLDAPFDYLLGDGDDDFDAGRPGFSDSHRGPSLPPIDSPRGDGDDSRTGSGGRPVDQTPNLGDLSGTSPPDEGRRRLDFDTSPGEPLYPGDVGRLTDFLNLDSPGTGDLVSPAPPTGRLSVGPIDPGPEPDLPQEEGPRPKRRRRRGPWLDEETTLDMQKYHNTANITLESQKEFSLSLPQSLPSLPHPTVSSNMSDSLSVSLRLGSEVAEHELQELRAAQAARDAEAAAAAAQALAAAGAAVRDALDVDFGRAPATPGRDTPSHDGAGWHFPDFHGDGGRSGDEHPLPGLNGPGLDDMSPGHETPPPRDDASSPQPGTHDGRQPGSDAGRHSGSGDGPPGDDPPGDDSPGEDLPGDDLPGHDPPGDSPGRSPGVPGQDARSYFQVIADSGMDAERAACLFVGLLSKHMEGTIFLEQETAYGDILIRRPEPSASGGA
mmetsp:Transcript_84668/g.155246  ORF Transcript_84668/g.155246 Transcript_84668/m.155246 type:complete len:669 (+) Transcript_84668:93-2099(+)